MIESTDSSVLLVPSVELSLNSPSWTENILLELNWITGTRRVFSRIAFSHLFEFGFKDTKLVVIEVKPAVRLVASFISDFVIPTVLLVTILPIVEYHFSVSGSSKDKIFVFVEHK